MANPSPDELYEKAVMLVRARNRACTATLQRTFVIGYNRAARLLDAMEHAGVVSPHGENGIRTVLPVAAPPLPSTAPEGAVTDYGTPVDERAAFEVAAHIAEGYGPGRPIAIARPSDLIQGRWEGEQAASANIARLIRERGALASRTAEASIQAVQEKEKKEKKESLQREVGDEGLPPLPESLGLGMIDGQEVPAYTAEQFRQGQRDAVAAYRVRVSRAMGLLREARAALEAWKDVAPAVSLCADIDKALAANRNEGGK